MIAPVPVHCFSIIFLKKSTVFTFSYGKVQFTKLDLVVGQGHSTVFI